MFKVNDEQYCCMTQDKSIPDGILKIKYSRDRNNSSEKIVNRNKKFKRNLIQRVNMFNFPSHTIVKTHKFIHGDFFEESKEQFFAKTYSKKFSQKEITNFDLTSINFDKYNYSKEREVQLNRELA